MRGLWRAQSARAVGLERDSLLLITTHPALREAFLGTTAAIELPLADALTDRLGAASDHTARVLAAGVAAAARIALEQWLEPVAGTGSDGFVVASGSLPELLRAALAPLAPALDAAEKYDARIADSPIRARASTPE